VASGPANENSNDRIGRVDCCEYEITAVSEGTGKIVEEFALTNAQMSSTESY